MPFLKRKWLHTFCQPIHILCLDHLNTFSQPRMHVVSDTCDLFQFPCLESFAKGVVCRGYVGKCHRWTFEHVASTCTPLVVNNFRDRPASKEVREDLDSVEGTVDSVFLRGSQWEGEADVGVLLVSF